MADITLVVLVYRSLPWLRWCMEGVEAARTDVSYRWLVVANDATDEVVAGLDKMDGIDWIDFRNDDPAEFYINRVYRAWNEGVRLALTDQVVMLNSDMYVSDGWLDSLVEARRCDASTLPCSLLVESGHLPSGMPEHVKDFGSNPVEFRRDEWQAHARQLARAKQYEPGRLYMPVLVNRQEFFDIGPYPEGNVGGVSGDKILFEAYRKAGFRWVTCLGSVVYHTQLGEQRWP